MAAPLRFYFPASGTPAVSPTVGVEWLHQNTLKRPLTSPRGSTTLSSTSAPYTPDAADHLGVDANSLIVQYVSDPLPAQAIAAQTVKLAQIAREIHANNNLVMTWKLWIWTAAGTVGPTLLALRRDDLELTTSNTSRFDSATTTAVTIGAGDRLVVDLGLGGNPGPDTTGTQGHGGAYRFGESGTTDAPESDGSISLTENPWLEFADDLFNPVPTGPATTAVASLRVRTSTTAVGVSLGLERRAVVAWAALYVPVFGLETHETAIQIAVSARAALAARKEPSAAVHLASTAQTASTWQADRASLAAVRGTAQAESAGTHDSLAGSATALVTAATRAENFSERRGAVTVVRTVALALPGTMGTQNVVALQAALALDMTMVSFHPPPGPFDPLEPVFLGAAYRGDTLLLPLWVARDQRGIVLDLTEADVWFTAKTDLADLDADAPTIQCTRDAGQIAVVEPAILGVYQVTIQPRQTRALLDDTVFNFDVQVVTDFPRTTTVRVGTLIIVRDVTRTGS